MSVGYIFTTMVKIGVLLMVVKEILFVLILMRKNHHTTMLLDMARHPMKHYKDCMTGVSKMDL